MVVRMRHTRSQSRNRRSHRALGKPALSKDESGNIHLRHRITKETGNYRGREVVSQERKIERLAKKVKERETAR
jgi:ribosomal protein L32